MSPSQFLLKDLYCIPAIVWIFIMIIENYTKTSNLQLFSSEMPMYRAFGGSWRLLQPPTNLSLTSNCIPFFLCFQW
ncbi:hypothetical protein SAMN04487852_10768 [Prevotella sp. tf2-5]|nr:hypothetical protein SAMN04487852_10768 [Prevotella sp. tf2-5]